MRHLTNFLVCAISFKIKKGTISQLNKSDHGKEFENKLFEEFCYKFRITHNFSAPRTPQQNSVVERKNRTFQEMVRTMLNESKVGDRFWKEAIHTSVYIQNRCMLRPNEDKTPYEIWFGRKATIKYFKIFWE